MKLFYELYNPSFASKKSMSPKSSHPAGNVGCHECDYSTVVLDIESSIMLSDPSLNIWVIDSGVSNYMVSLNKSCFTDYFINLSGINIIKGINGDLCV